MKSVSRLVFASARQWLWLVRSGNVWRTSDRLGQDYRLVQGGTYRIFRETHGRDTVTEPSGVLVVGFRLRVIGGHRICHWLFQRLCLLTTPFWSGFPGFRVKLWMVDPATKNYLGIYEWAGEDQAKTYVETLVKILRPLSTTDSVWYELYPGQAFDTFLSTRRVYKR